MMRTLYNLITAASLLVTIYPIIEAEVEKGCRVATAGVYVAISSEAEYINGTGYLRWVDAHWYGINDFQPGDMIGVWRNDPSVSMDFVIEQQEVFDTDGMVRIQERWNGSLVPSFVMNMEDTCLPYWAGYIRNDTVLYSSCLKLRPNWMKGMVTELSAIRLSEVALPGTHDAGAAGHFSTIIGSIFSRWTFTQDENFWEQLVFGVRYMDLRIGYYNNTDEKYFVHHGGIRVAPLQLYIDDVAFFMAQTEEIVIFDIHELSNDFDRYPSLHTELIAILELNFGAWMVPNYLSPNPTISEIWESGTRLIVTYPSSEGASSPFLWNKVYHLWGDVNDLDDLKTFMYSEIPQQSGRGSLWSAMTEFTPTPLDVTLDRWGGLRGAAAITNPPVTKWFREDWWNMVNIVAMDFFLASDVVSVAVEANFMKFKCPNTKAAAREEEHSISSSDSTYIRSYRKNNISSEARIWLWVSALASISLDGLVTQRQFEINWDVTSIQEGDWIGLYDHDPSVSWLDPLEQATPQPDTVHYLTYHSFPHVVVNASMEESTCLGWWAAYIRNDTPIAVNCIKVHPRWMSSMKDVLRDVPIRSIVIPGNHDAGTYTPFSEFAENALMKYAITQDESIYNTLIYGYRNIDLRVGYFEADPNEPYWVVHGITVWRPFRTVLQEIRNFAEITNDVSIIEIGGFTFFNSSEQHYGCLALVMEELAGLMAPNINGWDSLMGDLLNSSTNLIMIYHNAEAVTGNEFFWPNFEGHWANAQSIEQLEAYMIDVIEGINGPPNPPWSLSGQLTPLANDVVLDTLGGLRPMADSVNRNVTRWFYDRWWDKISFVSCDFVLSSGYVELAIDINYRRFG